MLEHIGLQPVQRLADVSEQALSELEQHIAGLPVDAKRIQGLPTPLTGQIASAGTVTAGTGFTVNRSATGVYDVTFTVAFAAAPTVVASALDSGSIDRAALVSAVSTTGCTIKTTTLGAVAVNTGIHFVAFTTA